MKCFGAAIILGRYHYGDYCQSYFPFDFVLGGIILEDALRGFLSLGICILLIFYSVIFTRGFRIAIFEFWDLVFFFIIIIIFFCMFYQLLRVQHSCSSTKSWGSVKYSTDVQQWQHIKKQETSRHPLTGPASTRMGDPSGPCGGSDGP